MNISCDILVIGAGASGASAALASARSGVRTVLIEKEDYPGGAGYSGLFQYICGLYLNGDAFPAETLNNGMVHEIVGLLNNLSPDKTIKKIGQVYVLPYYREDLRSVFTSLCEKETNLTVFYNAFAVSVETGLIPPIEKGGIFSEQEKIRKITKVKVDCQGNLYSITPNIIIDCSGSGDVSAMAGADFELSPPDELQLAGYVIYLKGLKDMNETLAIKVPYYLSEAADKKILPEYLRFSVFSPGDDPDEGYCKISIKGSDSDEREQRAKEDASTVHRYLADKLPSFKNSYIAETSLRVMDREGRRICGEYTLTEEDVLNARKFHDGVVKNSWPIEIWNKNRGTIYKYVKSGDYYEIPFRCLKVKDISNLLCAGRCISVSHEALGSTRVIGTCITLGEQAGLAAANYVRKGSYT
jgi:hypothetical protein